MGLIVSESSTVQQTTLEFDDWWLKDPHDSSHNLLIHIDGGHGGLDRTENQESATYHPIGRKYPVVVTDVIQGIVEELDVVFSDAEDDYQQFRTLFGLQKTLLIQSGWLNAQWYIRFIDKWKERIDNVDPPYRIVNVTYVEQDVPE